MNGCGSFNSDMDLCAMIDPSELICDTQRNQALRALNNIKSVIGKNIPYIKHMIRIKAVVPILQITFKGPYNGK